MFLFVVLTVPATWAPKGGIISHPCANELLFVPSVADTTINTTSTSGDMLTHLGLQEQIMHPTGFWGTKLTGKKTTAVEWKIAV